jgi:NAD(P)-dependent dehydrogenase (short-subunit alcohol dehydrogenase family)
MPALVITGASRGIGAATAELAAAKGWSVCVNYNSHPDEAARVVDAIRKNGGKAIAAKADMANEAEIVAMFERSDRELGPLGGLVNNAGFLGGEYGIMDFDAVRFRAMWEVNVTAYFICAREAVRRMAKSRGGQGGAIVNLSSLAAEHGGIGPRIHYATSNGARRTFSLGLAKQVGPEGIRVNAILPGFIDTHFNDDFGNEDRNRTFGPRIPLQRIGTAEDVARTIVWLLSEEASYVSGAAVHVTGAFM